jgi:hypothetical protein
VWLAQGESAALAYNDVGAAEQPLRNERLKLKIFCSSKEAQVVIGGRPDHCTQAPSIGRSGVF